MNAQSETDREGESPKVSTHRTRRFLRRFATLFALAAIVLLFAALKPTIFLTVTNIRNVLLAAAVGGVVAVAQTVVMTLGDFDLSVGSNADMVGMVLGLLMVKGHVTPVVGVVIGLAIGALCGLVNGILVSYVNISAFIATLGTLTMFGGMALLLNDGHTIFGFPVSFNSIGQGKVGPIPIPVIILIVVCMVMYFVMARTTLGRWWYAVGGNGDASYLAGLRVKRLRLLAFVACGLGAALGGILLTARLSSANPTSAEGMMIQSITAVFIGMTAFKDGQPNIAGTVVGILILGVLTNGMNLTHVDSYTQMVITGAVTVLAVSLSGVAKSRRA